MEKISNVRFIYGLGLTARDVYRIVKKNYGGDIIFLDRMVAPEKVSDLECENWLYTDERIAQRGLYGAPVYVGIMNTEGNIRKVISTLRKEGFTNIIPYAKLADIYPADFNFLYIEAGRKFEERMSEVKKAREILFLSGTDERSLKVWDGLVKFRLTKDYNELPDIDDKTYQYYPPFSDIPGYATNNISFIDCGAYRGDTFEAVCCLAKKYTQTISAYYAFEADAGSRIDLEKKLSYKCIEGLKRIVPFAVTDRKKRLFFDMSGTTASHVLYEGDLQAVGIDGISIDEIIYEIPPTHIKMDIEGEEQNALIGAKQTIQKYKPRLAISIYHKPEDLYKIVQMIEEMSSGYRYYVRVYDDVGVDTVLYAVPI